MEIWSSLFHNEVFERLSKAKKSKQCSVENQLKLLEWDLNCDVNSVEYIYCKNQLEGIYDDIAECIKVWTKCKQYEEVEKTTKFFQNLGKTTATQGTVKSREINNKEIDNPVEINKKKKPRKKKQWIS